MNGAEMAQALRKGFWVDRRYVLEECVETLKTVRMTCALFPTEHNRSLSIFIHWATISTNRAKTLHLQTNATTHHMAISIRHVQFMDPCSTFRKTPLRRTAIKFKPFHNFSLPQTIEDAILGG